MDNKLRRVDSIDEISSVIAEIRSLRLGFVTNFYLDPVKLSLMISKGDCYAERIDNSFFIVKRSSLFWNVYFCSTSLEQLVCDLPKFQEQYGQQTMMFDIVGSKVQCLPIVAGFQGCNCEIESSFVRMKRLPDTTFEDPFENKVIFADGIKVSEINHLLHVFFNERTEQIPYWEELLDFSQKGQILEFEEKGVLAGFLIFEKSPSTLYLRYWFTLPDFREQKVGSSLFRRFLEEGRDTKRQLLWVNCSNENAIKRYRHYGFAEENMFDYIMRFN